MVCPKNEEDKKKLPNWETAQPLIFGISHIAVHGAPPLDAGQVDGGEPAEPLAEEQDGVGRLHGGLLHHVAHVVNLQQADLGLFKSKGHG